MLSRLKHSDLTRGVCCLTAAALLNLALVSCGETGDASAPPRPADEATVTARDAAGNVLTRQTASAREIVGPLQQGLLEIEADGDKTTDLSRVFEATRSVARLKDGTDLVLGHDGTHLRVIEGPSELAGVRLALEHGRLLIRSPNGEASLALDVEDSAARNNYYGLQSLLMLSGLTGLDGIEEGRCDPVICVTAIIVGGVVAIVLGGTAIVTIAYISCILAGNYICGEVARRNCRNGVSAYNMDCNGGVLSGGDTDGGSISGETNSHGFCKFTCTGATTADTPQEQELDSRISQLAVTQQAWQQAAADLEQEQQAVLDLEAELEQQIAHAADALSALTTWSNECPPEVHLFDPVRTAENVKNCASATAELVNELLSIGLSSASDLLQLGYAAIKQAIEAGDDAIRAALELAEQAVEQAQALVDQKLAEAQQAKDRLDEYVERLKSKAKFSTTKSGTMYRPKWSKQSISLQR